MRIAEIFLSLQGEGPSAGTPAHFIRLQGCDVGCHWCDTKYTWSAEGGESIGLEELWSRARSLGEAKLLVVTGGEPLEQTDAAEVIAAGLERWERVEVETSGIAPPPLSHPRLFYNVSPKLPSATPRWAETWRHVRDWIAEPRATFKLVAGGPPDPDDLLRLVEEHGVPRTRVVVMPEGLTDAAVRTHAGDLAELCKREGFRLGPRLHVWLWGARRGV
jgi:7-carboxy-7-deazaguanine synthase